MTEKSVCVRGDLNCETSNDAKRDREGSAQEGHYRCGRQAVQRARLSRREGGRYRRARRALEGHDLPVLREQGEPVLLHHLGADEILAGVHPIDADVRGTVRGLLAGFYLDLPLVLCGSSGLLQDHPLGEDADEHGGALQVPSVRQGGVYGFFQGDR